MSKPVRKASAAEPAATPMKIELTPASASCTEGIGAQTVGITRISLSALDQRAVAVCCRIRGREETLLGKGTYEQDPNLGPVLRIDSPEHPELQFTIAERSWDGEIFVGGGPAWDFLIRLFT